MNIDPICKRVKHFTLDKKQHQKKGTKWRYIIYGKKNGTCRLLCSWKKHPNNLAHFVFVPATADSFYIIEKNSGRLLTTEGNNYLRLKNNFDKKNPERQRFKYKGEKRTDNDGISYNGVLIISEYNNYYLGRDNDALRLRSKEKNAYWLRQLSTDNISIPKLNEPDDPITPPTLEDAINPPPEKGEKILVGETLVSLMNVQDSNHGTDEPLNRKNALAEGEVYYKFQRFQYWGRRGYGGNYPPGYEPIEYIDLDGMEKTVSEAMQKALSFKINGELKLNFEKYISAGIAAEIAYEVKQEKSSNTEYAQLRSTNRRECFFYNEEVGGEPRWAVARWELYDQYVIQGKHGEVGSWTAYLTAMDSYTFFPLSGISSRPIDECENFKVDITSDKSESERLSG